MTTWARPSDVLVAQENLPEALKSFKDSLAIADRPALAILKPLAAAGRLDARRSGWIARIEAEIAALEAK